MGEILQDEVDLEGKQAILITFEPLFEKYIALLRRCDEATANHSAICQHRRGIAIPFAVGYDGVKDFHITRDDQCSSFFPPNQQFTHNSSLLGYFDAAACTEVTETVAVPGVTLEVVIGKWLEGREIDYLKIDAQGYDYEVVRSAGR